ncbi:hypothetical protein AB0G60_09680 [Streptomyces angustmyceticus]|uniref:Secreted protein n=1 Tax=Streptomyces angustmyceticus TaxID=285578 RepID=A0A5J4LG73_9ACTN|nr:hypothetical protein [Streptomyces angustmyceticus]GES31072.1 hypothetical protein San01_35590 [Streptomyces angustmyceticus]
MTVAGASIACAAGAWFVGDDLVQRVLAAGAAAAAVTGAVLLRTWDRTAGRRVAELDRARVRDEWRTEERIAELETDVEESRERRAGLETKLRSKRAELARLRSEHAALLRRYATAETERASALEGRRLLAIEAAAPAKALPAAAALPRALHFVRAGETSAPARHEPVAHGDGPARTTASYADADRALRQLARNAARQRTARKAARTPRDGAGTEGTTGSGPAAGRDARGGRGGDDGRGNPPAAAGQRTGGADARTAAAGPALRPVPATAAAVVPSRPAATSRAQGGFDFFGNATATGPGPRELTAPLEDDLADVVGDEALAEQSARARARTAHAARSDARSQPSAEQADADGGHADGARADGQRAQAEPADGEQTDSEQTDSEQTDGEQGVGEQGVGEQADGEQPAGATTAGATTAGSGEVIDLTAHDETDQFEVGALRSAIS